jgi:phytoene synthase
LDALYAQAAEATRAGSRGFFFATRHFPIDLARSAHAVYWFCHYTIELGRRAARAAQAGSDHADHDDRVDQRYRADERHVDLRHIDLRHIDLGHIDLDQWASMVDAGLRGRLARHPVLDVFLDTVDQRAIPHAYPAELIEGVRMDLDYTRYASFSQLRGRCQRIGGMVSLMLTHVIGFRGPALDYMADLGIAIELTTLLRDTAAHLERGVIYLPTEEMDAAGYTEAELRQYVRDNVRGNLTNDAFRSLMRVQTERIAGYYQKAEAALPLLDPRGRFAVKVAYDLYRQTLRHIESSDFDIFRGANVPAVERAWIAARSMAGPITRRLWKAMSA